MQYTYPGVYVREPASGLHPIAGVATSITAFVGKFAKGTTSQPTRVFSFADVERELGGLATDCPASYGLQQFFLNGGSEAVVVRVTGNGALRARAEVPNRIAGEATLDLIAENPGAWGNELGVSITPDTASDATMNVVVRLHASENGREIVVREETFSNVDIVNPSASNHIARVFADENRGSALVRVDQAAAPKVSGTLSAKIDAVMTLTNEAITLSIGGSAAIPLSIGDGTAQQASAPAVAAMIENRARAEAAKSSALDAEGRAAFAGLRVRAIARREGAVTVHRLWFWSTSAKAESKIQVTAGSLLGFGAGANVSEAAQEYRFEDGEDGDAPAAADFLGSSADKTGIHNLDHVDLFNLLCIPETPGLATGQESVLSGALDYCERRRAFFLIDPIGLKPSTATTSLSSAHRNSAVFFPRLTILDPLASFAPKSIAASGTIAGIMARTDATRGVWKAPAGIDAKLRNVTRLDYVLSDGENGLLNAKGVNCLRTFPIHGSVVWGSRTRVGADTDPADWKYIPVRRLALFLEESLYRGTQWVVFEPNDEPLWSQIRLNIGAFMQGLFLKGAFQGSRPDDAYFVRCDSDTTTPYHVLQGIVNIEVGFAPLKPAEFVVLKIQQITRNMET